MNSCDGPSAPPRRTGGCPPRAAAATLSCLTPGRHMPWDWGSVGARTDVPFTNTSAPRRPGTPRRRVDRRLAVYPWLGGGPVRVPGELRVPCANESAWCRYRCTGHSLKKSRARPPTSPRRALPGAGPGALKHLSRETCHWETSGKPAWPHMASTWQDVATTQAGNRRSPHMSQPSPLAAKSQHDYLSCSGGTASPTSPQPHRRTVTLDRRHLGVLEQDVGHAGVGPARGRVGVDAEGLGRGVRRLADDLRGPVSPTTAYSTLLL